MKWTTEFFSVNFVSFFEKSTTITVSFSYIPLNQFNFELAFKTK